MAVQQKENEDQRKHKQHSDKLQNNKDVAYIYADNKADVEGMKESGQNLRKAAEIAAAQQDKNDQKWEFDF